VGLTPSPWGRGSVAAVQNRLRAAMITKGFILAKDNDRITT
jgi:hypothetical protein